VDGSVARGEESDAGPAVSGAAREATLIAGDGIGPEITAATLQVLDALGLKFDWDEEYGGMAAVEKAGTRSPHATLDSIRRTRLCLKGRSRPPSAAGTAPSTSRLRQEFDLYANVRRRKTIVPGGRYEAHRSGDHSREHGRAVRRTRSHLQIGGDRRAMAQAMSIVTRAGSERIAKYRV